MKKLLKLFGMVAVLTALPVAFTGGSSNEVLGVGVNNLCARDGGCLMAYGAVCRIGPEPVWHKREAGELF